MPIINNFISSKKLPSDKIGYDYLYQTLFYNVYVKYDEETKINRYFMASSEKKSLFARLHFYKKYISEIEYPVIDNQGRPEYLAGNSQLVAQHVLSLPKECFYLNKNLLSVDEVVKRITFIDNLNINYDKEIEADDYFITGQYYRRLVNHLMSNGFYFINLELLSTENRSPSFDQTPFIIDEEKFLLKYDKPTAERIYISFLKIFNITPRDYLESLKKIDSMSIKEQINYAYEVKEGDATLDILIKDAIIDYYYSILRKECREYFNIHNSPNIKSIKYSVIDHQSGNHFSKYNYFAFGTHYSLVAKSTREFKKVDGKITEVIKPKNYMLLSQDIDQLRNEYNCLKKYLLLNPQFGFMPHLFIKYIGLPYEVIELVRNFNFKEGSFDDFIKLIPILETKEEIKYNLVDTTGQVIDFENEFSYILKNLSKNKLYILNYDKDTFLTSNIIIGKTDNKYLVRLFSSIFKLNDNQKKSLGFADFRKESIKLSANKRKFTNKTLRYAFEIGYLSDTVKYDESYFEIFESRDEYIDELEDILFSIKGKNQSFNSSSYLEKHEIIFNNNLPLPYMHLGNNFIGYSKKENDKIYFDEKSKSSIKEFMEIINYYYSIGIKHYYFYTSNFDNDLAKIRIYKKGKSILGLPSSLNDLVVLSSKKNEVYNVNKTLENLSFKKEISTIENNLSKIFIDDPRISYLLLFENILLNYHIIPYIYLGRYNDLLFTPYLKHPNKNFTNIYEKNYFLLGLDNLPPLDRDDLELISSIEFDLHTYIVFVDFRFDKLFDYDEYFTYLDAHKSVWVLEKLYFNFAFERLFTNNHFYNQEPVLINNKPVYVLYGELFNAYSYDNVNFFFNEKDLNLMYDAYLFNSRILREDYRNNEKIDQVAFGAPYLTCLKLYDLVRINRGFVPFDEFKEAFKFSKTEISIPNDFVYDHYLKIRKANSSLYDINSLVKYYAMENGLYIHHASSSEIDYMLNFEDKNADYDEFLDLVDHTYVVYVNKHISNEVESFIKPKKSLFFALLQNFTMNLSSLQRMDIQKLLKLKYHVEKLYDEDPLFIYKLVNKINSFSRKKIIKYLEDNTTYLSNSRIDLPYKIKKEELVEYLVAFISFVIHNLLKTLCKHQ